MSDKITWTNTSVKLGDLKPWADNPKLSTKAQAKRILDSWQKFGQVMTVAVSPTLDVYDGHQRLSVLLTLYGGDYVVDARQSNRHLTDEERRAMVLALTNATGSWNWDSLAGWKAEELQGWGFDKDTLDGWGKDYSNLKGMLESEEATDANGEAINPPAKTLAERFGVPPFSVLDARQGYWQARKAAWIALGIQSEVGRDAFSSADARTFKGATQNVPSNMTAAAAPSIFDPVLCELACLWFCPPAGVILDPFAGGSVRGIVASRLAYHYIGIDLRPEQIEANEKQAAAIVPDNKPVWMEGDSRSVLDNLNTQVDFIFSCPPYFDLELYSDNEKDLSNAGDYEAFIEAYREIISKAMSKLKDNRFACFVVSDIRDKQGFYRNFPADTISAFEDAGAILYNDAVLVTPLGTVMMQTSRNFPIGRKLGKTHQNVLVFYKGNPKAIRDELGYIEIVDLAEQYGEVS